ncbi:hypothetical protein Y1Q_0011701 [Alligator mississippiensis]|uniref:Uncharacterized protein n=1 Tax=Alligator mississippiensis TaxID=8496 RepID=A0A151M0T1_ALLMI|nr:hypothetical protein Y1Q_0011701 [Alligator mississippiensis]
MDIVTEDHATLMLRSVLIFTDALIGPSTFQSQTRDCPEISTFNFQKPAASDHIRRFHSKLWHDKDSISP